MRKWPVILGVAVIFLAGMVAGVGLTRIVLKRQIEKVATGGPDAVREIVVRRLSRRLNLNAEERLAINGIVRETQSELAVARSTYQPGVARILSGSVAKMKAVLRPGQAQNLQVLCDEARALWRPEAPQVEPAIRH